MPQSTLRVVAIGGGTGLATLLRGLKRYVHAEGPWTITDLGAIVTVTDEGGEGSGTRGTRRRRDPKTREHALLWRCDCRK